jgi:fatty-acyl-CoA synthase
MTPEPNPPPRPPGGHLAHWPPGLPKHLEVPQANVFHNLEASAARFPDKPFVIFRDTPLSYARFKADAERVAGFLQQACGVKAGDRVLLCMRNRPEWMLAYYGILRADAVVVPMNPMNLAEDLRHGLQDSGAAVAFVSEELQPRIRPLLGDGPGHGLRHVVAVAGDDGGPPPGAHPAPAATQAPRAGLQAAGTTAWHDVLALALRPGPIAAGPDDPCVMPYTSGTTGRPRGCLHTHRSVMSSLVGSARWFGTSPDTVALSVLPYFHVTGMTGGMNAPMFAGATVVLLPRWDREAAADAIQRHRVTSWQLIATMMVDFLAHPRIEAIDLSSLREFRGGGAAMPEALAARLRRLTGLDYVEGYGLSETMAATHVNPPHRPKAQCLGIPVFDVDARVVDPVSLAEMPAGEVGEIVLRGPQVMTGYWNDPQATEDAFVTLDGERFLRTGDLARIDADGYFFMVDRLKRIINAAGFKVSPAEVEALLYRHPAIQEACVIAAPDARRGETVKALVVLRPGQDTGHRLTEAGLIDWARGQMAAYKIPRRVAFVDALPRSASGKVAWRLLQEREKRDCEGSAMAPPDPQDDKVPGD